jgi:hypothetical protein
MQHRFTGSSLSCPSSGECDQNPCERFTRASPDINGALPPEPAAPLCSMRPESVAKSYSLLALLPRRIPHDARTLEEVFRV